LLGANLGGTIDQFSSMIPVPQTQPGLVLRV
jgi:hypothetical protein